MIRTSLSKSSVTPYSSPTEHPTLPGPLCATLMARCGQARSNIRRPSHKLLGASSETLRLSHDRHSTLCLTSPAGHTQARKYTLVVIGVYQSSHRHQHLGHRLRFRLRALITLKRPDVPHPTNCARGSFSIQPTYVNSGVRCVNKLWTSGSYTSIISV